MWLLYLSSRTIFSSFFTLRLASSPKMLLCTISISYSRRLKVSRSSTKGIWFLWTRWNWSVLSPCFLLMNKLKILDVFSDSWWFLCKWRATARIRHRLLIYGCLVFSSNVKLLIVWHLGRGSCNTASLHPIGTTLSKSANTVKIVNL